MARKIIVFVGILLAVVLSMSLAGCTSKDEATSTPEPPEVIKLGGTLPLTGAYADTAQWIERGYRYWAEQVNEQGGLLGREVELIIYDDEGDPDKAVSLLETVITEDKADLLFGGYPGTTAAQQMAIAEGNKMVYISMGGHMPSFEQGFTFSFGAPPLMGQWWYEGFWQWADTLSEAERPQKMAMITVNNAVGLSVRENSITGAERLGIDMVMDELYDLPLESAEDLAAQAKEAEADLFIANGFLPDGVAAVQAMEALDYNPAFFLQGVGSLIPTWIEELGGSGNYVFSGTSIHPKLPFAGMDELNAVTESQYGLSETPAYFLFGYAWLQTLQAGVEGIDGLDQEAIRDYLKSHEIVTVGGTFTFDDRGLPEPYSYLTQVQPTGVELIWPLEVRTADPVYPKPFWGE